jgi:hypothetical protein
LSWGPPRPTLFVVLVKPWSGYFGRVFTFFLFF